MMRVPAPGKRRPRNLWLIVRTCFLVEHESVLEEVLLSMNALDIEYLTRPILWVQHLTATDLLLLKLSHPNLSFIEDDEGQCLIEGHRAFQDVEQTIVSIGSHLLSARLIIAEFAIRDTKTYKTLEKKFAERPDVFETGLQVLENKACLR